jgi:hypothetical protein
MRVVLQGVTPDEPHALRRPIAIKDTVMKQFLRTWIRLIIWPAPRHDDDGDMRPQWAARRNRQWLFQI